jgi:hypothetical protein
MEELCMGTYVFPLLISNASVPVLGRLKHSSFVCELKHHRL